MPTLAPKLPWNHPFAGGYPRLGGQALPTDPDAIDYLNRVAAADGAAVEVGVAMAVDQFIKGCKADGIWSALQASCILCGARTISGALVPLAGTAPTAYSFASGDYDRSSGLKGDGATKYLDSNFAGTETPLEDQHLACYATVASAAATHSKIGVANTAINAYDIVRAADRAYFYSRTTSFFFTGTGIGNLTGMHGMSRSGGTVSGRVAGVDYSAERAAVASPTGNNFVFAYNLNGAATEKSSGRLAFYSAGSALDLALLDNRVSTLVSAIAAAL